MQRKSIIYTGIALAVIAIAGLFYRDYQSRQPIAEQAVNLAAFDEIRGLVERHQDKIATHFNLKPFAPSREASLASPFCAGKRYFEGTTILNKSELTAMLRFFAPADRPLVMKAHPEEAWFTNDGTFGLLLKSSGGIGLFRDYYHEVVYDPHNRVLTESLDKECYPTIMVNDLSGHWKYRVVSSQWD